ncbi:MAG: GMC family oxidoreductase [Deltaproteobacteria bacterium]|nr:GMC family oxidoreductase [Deltaproteobacteria bacterium]MBW2532726.1 GMC family oxidoreductase [Deltaproteobacteria bacterium]
MTTAHYDFVIIGSGFGGSVSALRLVERGYDVLVVEKGRRFAPEQFAKSNWDLRRWFWLPKLGLQGIFQMTFLPHVTIVHGVGVGGGSLCYANTLPVPKGGFFDSPSWAHLADWRAELEPHYATAQRMLGVARNPKVTRADQVIEEIAEDLGRRAHFHLTDVGVYFGEPDRTVRDPYFDGEGPDRTGCTHCGGCMTGCRVGAKNTLDRNYLYLAERKGATVRAETEVVDVRPRSSGQEGYRITLRPSLRRGRSSAVTADRVIFAGGALGTVPLLLKLREDGSLPALSERVGKGVRTNSEALIGVVTTEPDTDLSEGIAITSILHTDDHSHIEPCRYAKGSGFWRMLLTPHAPGATAPARLVEMLRRVAAEPLQQLRAATVRDFGMHSQILLYMRSLDGTLTMKLGRNAFTGFRRGLTTELDDPAVAPRAFMEEATDLARRFASKVQGVVLSLFTEALLGTPSTAHILGGCCIGDSPETGAIDTHHRLFGYDGLYVMDGSAVSANPGVNPSLTITAMTERACSLIAPKG